MMDITVAALPFCIDNADWHSADDAAEAAKNLEKIVSRWTRDDAREAWDLLCDIRHHELDFAGMTDAQKIVYRRITDAQDAAKDAIGPTIWQASGHNLILVYDGPVPAEAVS